MARRSAIGRNLLSAGTALALSSSSASARLPQWNRTPLRLRFDVERIEPVISPIPRQAPKFNPRLPRLSRPAIAEKPVGKNSTAIRFGAGISRMRLSVPLTKFRKISMQKRQAKS